MKTHFVASWLSYLPPERPFQPPLCRRFLQKLRLLLQKYSWCATEIRIASYYEEITPTGVANGLQTSSSRLSALSRLVVSTRCIRAGSQHRRRASPVSWATDTSVGAMTTNARTGYPIIRSSPTSAPAGNAGHHMDEIWLICSLVRR